MDSVVCRERLMQPIFHSIRFALAATLIIQLCYPLYGDEKGKKLRSVLPVENSQAKTPSEMKKYTDLVEHTDGKIEMVPIPGGQFLMGSPESEKDRKEDEGPQHQVKISPFWMSQYEITWDVYEIWMFDLDVQRRKIRKVKPNERDAAADE